jgi:hypothetical protein
VHALKVLSSNKRDGYQSITVTFYTIANVFQIKKEYVLKIKKNRFKSKGQKNVAPILMWIMLPKTYKGDLEVQPMCRYSLYRQHTCNDKG